MALHHCITWQLQLHRSTAYFSCHTTLISNDAGKVCNIHIYKLYWNILVMLASQMDTMLCECCIIVYRVQF